jgi:hypothetical protein
MNDDKDDWPPAHSERRGHHWRPVISPLAKRLIERRGELPHVIRAAQLPEDRERPRRVPTKPPERIRPIKKGGRCECVFDGHGHALDHCPNCHGSGIT